MISTMFPGVAVELFYAVSLVLAAYGAGTSALRASGRKAGVISNLACGIVLLAAVGVFLPEKVVSVLMWPLVPLGVWYILPEIKKERKVFAVTTLLMLFTLGAALLPPYEWDEQVYQTALLRYYSESGFFSVKPDNPYSAYPSLPHSFLRYAFSGGGVTLPRLVIWLLSGIIAASFYVKFRDRSKKVTIAVLAAILLSPLSMILTRSFYAELYIVLFAFAGVEVLTEKEQNLQSSVLGGIMAAAACAVKLTGAGVAGALTVLLICRYRSTIFKVPYFIAAFFTALPFFLRVFLATGNPVYPYFSALFGNSPAACEVEKFHRMLGGHYGLDAVTGTLHGWILTALKPEFYDGVCSGWQFPVLFAGALIFVYIVSKKYPEEKIIFLSAAAALLTAYLFWGISSRQSRFLYPVLWGSGALLICAAARMGDKERRIIFFAVSFAAVTTFAVSNAPSMLRHYIYSWRIAGEARANPAAFIAGTDSRYGELLNWAENLERDAVCGMFLERRTLYFPRRAEIIMPGFQEKLTPVPDDAQKLYDAVKNYDYLVIMPPAADVDFSKGHIRDIAKLYTLAEVLRREGKLIALPQYQNMILRPEVTEAGMAEASNSARSASVESSDAFARKLPGKPRPFK